MAKRKIKELKADQLKHSCSPKIFKFETTDALDFEDSIISQDRALDAIEFALNIKSPGYNLYVSGFKGTGRNTSVLREIKKIASEEPVPDDICYIYNFDKNDKPKALRLPPGMGIKFQKDMEDLIMELEVEIQKAFLSEEYEVSRKEVVEELKKERELISTELDRHAAEKGFSIQQSLTGLVVVPVKNGKPINDEEYKNLSEEEKKAIEEEQTKLHDKIYNFLRKIRDIKKETKTRIEKLDEKIGLYTIGHIIDDYKKKYKDHPLIIEHLGAMVTDLIKNIDHFKKDEDEQEKIALVNTQQDQKTKILDRYKVNILVDNSKQKGAPVVVEVNPTYANLIGKIEYWAQFGVLTTDYTMIKPGSVHRANGGYLVIQASDLFKDIYAWEELKKIIKYKKIKIESLYEKFGLLSTSTLKPDPVEVDFKVVIIGNQYIYHILYNYDDEFNKLFKVKAEFDSVMKKTSDRLQKLAYFIAAKCKEENLLPFTNTAVAGIIEYSSRLSEHKKKLTARFLDIIDIMNEADYWARKEDADLVDLKHVKIALDKKVYRSNLIEVKMRDLIDEKTIFVDVDGEKIGQINGLSVLDFGDYMFGKPSRITVETFMGKGEIIDIQRETKMSGRIHSKGVMILSSFIGEKFGKDKPLSFTASICFEQVYDEVDGDSASSTELYCLLSSLADLPLRQDIAVTGSVNQKGEIQPVGGINEKIEGFYKVCKMIGLTGKQGVMIPDSNVKHLMLNDDVVESVKEGRFHIYPVSTIETGIEILTGKKAGNKLKNGSFSRESVFESVDKKIREYSNYKSDQKD